MASRRGWVRYVLWGVGGFVALIVAAVAAVALLVSPDTLIREQLVAQVKSHTGRDLTIAGGASFTLWPSAGVALANISLSPPPGMPGRPTVEADRLHLSVAVLPLLSGRLVIDRASLHRPMLDLRVDGKGRKSWTFASPYPTAPRRYAQTNAGGSGGGLDYLDAIELKGISLTDGTVRYSDERAGLTEVVSGLDVAITGRRIAEPMDASGGLDWNGQRVSFTGKLDTLRALLREEAAKARFDIKSSPVTAAFDGTVTLGDVLRVRGDTSMTAVSLVELLRWVGTELPNGKPLGGVSARGFLSVIGPTIGFGGAKLALGTTRAEGRFAVRTGGARPLLTGDLKISELDIDKLSAHFAGARPVPRTTAPVLRPSSAAASRPVEKPTAAAGATPPRSIEDLIRRNPGPSNGQAGDGPVGRFSPQVRGYVARQGWSGDKIDTAALLLVDVNTRLAVDGLKVAGLAIGRTVVRLTLKDGAARADLDDMVLYQGRGRGVVTAQRAGGGLSVGLNVSVENVAAQPLLKDAAQFDRIAGTGQFTAAVAGAGSSQQAIMSSLKGQSRFVFANGALVGWNVAKIVRGLRQGQFGSFESVPTEQTDFSELSASFTIEAGVAKTSDLRMASPLVRLAGTGAVDLGQRQMDMIFRPKFVGDLAGQGGNQSLAGLEVPLRVQGPWDKPQVSLQIGDILNNREQIQNTIRSVRERFKGKNTKEILRGVLGDGKDGNAVGKALQGLFR